jgi:hypothetical protein
MFKFWTFILRYSKSLQEVINIETVAKIRIALETNQCKHLRRKWNRITTNKNSPFYIYSE